VESGALAARLQDVENTRTVVWLNYLEVAVKSPIFGYAPSQLGFALSGNFGEYLQSVGFKEIDYTSVHNAYLAIALRFGGVGLLIFLFLLLAAVRKAKQVLDMPEIPADKKDIIILPLVLLLAMSFTQMFEDTLPGSGKGTPIDVMFYLSLFVCHVYGSSLINHYKYKNTPQSEIKTLGGLDVIAKS
jgi:O-antigen ligase